MRIVLELLYIWKFQCLIYKLMRCDKITKRNEYRRGIDRVMLRKIWPWTWPALVPIRDLTIPDHLWSFHTGYLIWGLGTWVYVKGIVLSILNCSLFWSVNEMMRKAFFFSMYNSIGLLITALSLSVVIMYHNLFNHTFIQRIFNF